MRIHNTAFKGKEKRIEQILCWQIFVQYSISKLWCVLPTLRYIWYSGASFSWRIYQLKTKFRTPAESEQFLNLPLTVAFNVMVHKYKSTGNIVILYWYYKGCFFGLNVTPRVIKKLRSKKCQLYIWISPGNHSHSVQENTWQWQSWVQIDWLVWRKKISWSI